MDLLTPDFGLIFWQTITLLTVLLILKKFAWKPILNMIESRENDINLSLEGAAKARKLSQELTAQKGELILSANKEREKILAEAISLKNSIIEDAKTEAKRLVSEAITQSRELIHTERQEAINEIKSQVSILAINIAEKILSEKLSQTSENETLIKRSIANSFFKL